MSSGARSAPARSELRAIDPLLGNTVFAPRLGRRGVPMPGTSSHRSRTSPSIELSIISANSASLSPSNTPVTILAMLSVTASPSRSFTSRKGRRSKRRRGWQDFVSRAAPRIPSRPRRGSPRSDRDQACSRTSPRIALELLLLCAGLHGEPRKDDRRTRKRRSNSSAPPAEFMWRWCRRKSR